ncbi:MAG: pentapeptide repeat-containing protein, partial [Planctomycetota bacterium]
AAVFHESRIGGDAVFHESRIGGAAWFHDSRIGGAAGFHDSRIGGAAGFGGARIGGDAMFHESRIGGAAGFGGARIGGDAGFGGARIGGYTDFADCTFARQPRWWSARFWDGRFQGTGSMRSASFAQTRKDRAAFGGARAESAIRMLPPHRRRRPWWWWRLLGPTGWMMMVRRFASRVRLTDRPIADWGNARVLGEMDILARASLAALGVVPVIAAVWPTITSYIEQRLRVDPPSVLPWAWVTVFFAALLVVVGRMCYRGRCPDLIRGRSRFEFREQEMEEFRRTRDREGESRLLEARDDIRAAGENEHLRRAWHPDLIEVNARTMWLPQEISDIRWKQRRLPRSFFYDGPDEIDEARRTEAEAAIAEGREANEIDVVATPQPEISRTTLEDGIIKAGAEARYDLAALERPVSARTALWCYGLAFALLLTVIMYQCLVLMAETDIGVLIWFAERAVVVARYWRPFVIILPSLVFVLWLLDAFFGPNDAMDKKALEDPFDGEGVFGKRRADRS